MLERNLSNVTYFSQNEHNVTKSIICPNAEINPSSFGQTRHSVPKPDNSHLSDGSLIIMRLQLALQICSYNLQFLFVV